MKLTLGAQRQGAGTLPDKTRMDRYRARSRTVRERRRITGKDQPQETRSGQERTEGQRMHRSRAQSVGTDLWCETPKVRCKPLAQRRRRSAGKFDQPFRSRDEDWFGPVRDNQDMSAVTVMSRVFDLLLVETTLRGTLREIADFRRRRIENSSGAVVLLRGKRRHVAAIGLIRPRVLKCTKQTDPARKGEGQRCLRLSAQRTWGVSYLQ